MMFPISMFAPQARAEIIDTYPDFHELSSHEQEGKTYKVTTEIQATPGHAIFAIHGGNIEPGTGELAKEMLSHGKIQLYLFEALDTKDPLRLHLTSTHFDDPRALEIAAKNQHCLSLHGYEDHTSKMSVCVGGGDSSLLKKFMESTPPKSVELVACTGKLAGSAKKNIVNRCSSEGVQLELSTELRNKILKDDKFKKIIADWAMQIFTP